MFYCLVQQINAEQFLYPVADFDKEKKIVLIYQKSLDDIELWIWDCHQNKATQALSSFSTPANLRIMPSGNGFIFIDQGHIKVKEFIKRSAKTIPIYEPINSFSSMNWINNEEFYFIAREGDFFQIFQADTQSNVKRLTNQPINHLYPQKINEQLFYIKQDLNHNYEICLKGWDPMLMESPKKIEDTTLVTSGDQLCFLEMINASKGFYLKVVGNQSDENFYEFVCSSFENKNNKWESQDLFSFKIPLRYIHGPERLYESIQPFLPNYKHENHIYFVDYSTENICAELYNYHIPTAKKIRLSNEVKSNHKNNIIKSTQFIAPYLHNEKIYFGLIMHENRQINFMDDTFVQKNNHFELPFFQTKEKS